MAVGDILKSITPGQSKPDPETSLTVSEAGIILKNERRRMVVFALAETDEKKLTLGNLAETVASAENEKPPRQLESKERKQVYVALYQTHLPKLDSMDVIEYDQDRGTFERGLKFDSTLSVLQGVADQCVEDANRGELA